MNLPEARIELFSTLRLHQILLETPYDAIHLLLDQADETPQSQGERRANLGEPVHVWSLADASRSDFLTETHAVLRPHVETLARNRRLRDIQYQEVLQWKTGQPPRAGAWMMSGSPSCDIKTTLQGMTPHVQRLLSEIHSKKRYGDFATMVNLIQMMRRWGVDPDPGGYQLLVAAHGACGPDIPDAEVIGWRQQVSQQVGGLDLRWSGLSEPSLALVPVETKCLSLEDLPVTDAAIPHLLHLSGLTRLNLSGTAVSDAGLDLLGTLAQLRWLGVERTKVTDDGVARLTRRLPNLEVKR